MKKYFFLLLMLTVGIFPAQKRAIKKVLNKQQFAWNRGDLDAFMDGYWKNDSLLFIGSKGPTYGWQKTLDNYRKSYPNEDKMGKLYFTDLKIKMLGNKYAFVYGKWKLRRKDDEPSGIFTLVFQRFREGWKIITDHTE